MKDCTSDISLELIAHKSETFALYLYTTFCGTCQLAGKMLNIVEPLVQHVEICKVNVNYKPDIAMHYQVESVPCLLLFHEGELQEKIYAFQSVTYLYELLK